MQMTPREGGRHSWVDPNPRDEADFVAPRNDSYPPN